VVEGGEAERLGRGSDRAGRDGHVVGAAAGRSGRQAELDRAARLPQLGPEAADGALAAWSNGCCAAAGAAGAKVSSAKIARTARIPASLTVASA